MAIPAHIIKLGHARDHLRQHLAIDAGLESMDHRPLGSDSKQVDLETRDLCRAQMQCCRDNAHWEIAGMIGGSKITVWKERPDGGLEPSGARWAQDQFDAPGLASDRLYFDRAEWEALLATMTTEESRAYFAETTAESKSAPGINTKLEAECSIALGPQERAWLQLSKAIRLLHRILRTRLAGQEPAPWIDPPADPFDAECADATHRHRRTARTSLAMRRGLLSGDLTAHLEKDGQSKPLPGWVWENASAAENAFHFSWLPLDPMRDHGLQGFTDSRCFIRRAEFKAWLANPVVAELGELPRLPAAFDRAAMPDLIAYREPPDKPFIELTEALTWIAFTLAISRDEFAMAEQCRFGPFVRADWPDALRNAVASLATHASAGAIRVRGRYVASYSDHSAAANANTDYLADTQLRDFACFDSLHGGLERGTGLVWEANVLESALEGHGDGWRDVEVCRAELLKLFPPKVDSLRALTQPLPAALSEIGAVMALDEALSLIAHGTPSHDVQVWANSDGELRFLEPNGKPIPSTENGEYPATLQALRAANRALHAALSDGRMPSYVAPATGAPLTVPRLYWNGVDPESLHHVYCGMTPADPGAGCAVLLSRQAFNAWSAAFAVLAKSGGTVPPNRQLDHEEIIGQAAAMLAVQSGISIGSAAASIVAELPPNPKTGKPRDSRYIERMIAHLWEGGLSQSPP